ncbi:MAG: hypothetical protein ACRC3H_19820 [Lachnospiraceae bacterium]
MEIRYRLYPYPVLSYFSDDYCGCSFDTAIDAEKDGYALKVTCLGETDNKELWEAIIDDKAKFVYHFECAQTGYREVVSTSKKETVRIIPDKNLNGRLQICPFIVANTDISGYINDSFHEDYKGFKFDIESGCVLAIGKQVNIDIEKEINDLANTPSVFSIIKNSDESIKEMLVDTHQNKITIKLPETDYLNLKSIKSNFGVQPVLNSLTVIPALLYALEEVAKKGIAERDDYSIYAWYRAVRKALKQKFQCDIESEEFSEQNMLGLAQKLINIPLSDALQFLWDGYGTTDEEEEG